MTPSRRFLILFFLFAFVFLRSTPAVAQTVPSDFAEDAQAIIDAPAVPAPQGPSVTETPAVPAPVVPAEVSEVPAVPDTIAIPRFEETVQPEESSAFDVPEMDLEDVGAV
ncbi:MAG: hypothetical protein AAF733_13680, partial [Verrucomicrobiota bacterium]